MSSISVRRTPLSVFRWNPSLNIITTRRSIVTSTFLRRCLKLEFGTTWILSHVSRRHSRRTMIMKRDTGEFVDSFGLVVQVLFFLCNRVKTLALKLHADKRLSDLNMFARMQRKLLCNLFDMNFYGHSRSSYNWLHTLRCQIVWPCRNCQTHLPGLSLIIAILVLI